MSTYGGVPLTVQTLEWLFNVRLDHVVVMDFAGFKDLTTALDGVTVNVPASFTSGNVDGHRFQKGPMTLEGEKVLAFVRERYAFADGDYQRVKDQQAFFQGVIAKVTASETLANPATMLDLVNSVAPYLSVDKTLHASTIASLGFELRRIGADDVHTFTLPTRGTGWSVDGQSIVIMDMPAVEAIGRAMRSDSLGGYLHRTVLGGGT